MKTLLYFPIISKYIDRKQRSRLRLINKGYRQIKNEGISDLPLRLKNILSKVKLDDSYLSKFLLRRNGFDVELSLRQYLTERVLSLSFNKSILYSIGSNTLLRHPLPLEWRNALIEEGIEVDNFKSALLWRMFSLFYWAKGVLYGLKNILPLLKKQPYLGNYAYFSDLSDKCVSNDINRKNILNWYLQWNITVEEIDSVCHSVNGVSNSKLARLEIVKTDGLPYLKGTNVFRYGVFVIYASIYSFVYSIFQPVNGIFLAEILKTKRVDLASDNDLARDYLFHNSTPFYRPIWTYFAEERGSRILFYFYSTGHENFEMKGCYPLQDSWHLISWPYYLVWDKFQMNFVKRFDQHKSIIEEVGFIWFSSSGVFESNSKGAIAVFDVTPHRPTRYAYMGAYYEYYIFDIANQFLIDIQFVLNCNNIVMAHKMKRINKFAHKKYIRRVRRLNKKSYYIEVNPSMDATQVIQKTKACISMPFTSTALIAKLEGKPSVYYDPSGTVQKDSRAAHGIPVLSGIDELKGWIENINKDKIFSDS
tara:strand:- start:732 stop:2333 length:1602 start_codon:yes stop_codon:yes gene_type:complete